MSAASSDTASGVPSASAKARTLSSVARGIASSSAAASCGVSLANWAAALALIGACVGIALCRSEGALLAFLEKRLL